MRAITRPLIALALAAPLVGCDSVSEALAPSRDGEANAAIASTELTRLEASLLIAIAQITPTGVDDEARQMAVEAALPMVFSPADCVTSDIAGGTITANLDGCTGPRAITLTGVINIAFDDGRDGATELRVTAGNVQFEGTAVTINTTTEVPPGLGDTGELEVTTTGAGSGDGGALSGRRGSYTLGFDPSCLTLDGQWTSSVDTQVYQTIVTDFRRCGELCPAEGRIVYGETDAEQAAGGGQIDVDALTVSFDGSDIATYISTELAAGRVQLDCRAAQ